LDHSLWPLLRSYESNGSSEEILGSVLLKKVRRDEVVVATKVFGQVRPGPNGRGLSRKAILAEIGNSLRRLGTDYIDLYIIHRWDSSTPIKETLQALHDVVAAGKVRMFRLACAPRWTLRSSTKVATKAAARPTATRWSTAARVPTQEGRGRL
jgi:aryl-alcohol dehydrogenase-like predicted oxidoreductase